MAVKRYDSATSSWVTVAGVGAQGPAGTNGSDGSAPLTTKGDLLTRSSTAVTRLGVGTNNYVLTADSAEATGLKWAAVSGPSFKGVLVTNTTGQSINNATETALTFNLETYDTDSFHSTSSNTSRLTVPSNGYYFVYAKVRFAGNSSGYRYIRLKKNGSTSFQDIINYPPGSNDFSLYYGLALSANANDYFEIIAAQSSGGSLEVRGDDNGGIGFGCYYLGA